MFVLGRGIIFAEIVKSQILLSPVQRIIFVGLNRNMWIIGFLISLFILVLIIDLVTAIFPFRGIWQILGIIIVISLITGL